ncbi:MerR family transcriptional regulator [Streptomyces hainanensis]|uniref:MerR family transcriptional regulator n=1 Tax=Streptomyces hainanensis TaxID=402648 RepID=A0A4R4TLT0_9ACTN|nr:MerR family transcriptional regulator [Streptomyces hainanensis]TDC78740.1 MerR family transcriptional regulator [Streptomyces hainanensis]
MSIGELAGRFGLATHVLRHWESVGLLVPDRAPGGQRRYGVEELRRVAMIQIGKEAGLGLGDLRDLLAAVNDLGDRRSLLRHHHARLVERIARAQAAKRLIEEVLECPLPFDECPRARATIEARIPQD